MRSRRAQSGFTLLELLIALMLVGFLCIVLFASLRIAGTTLKHAVSAQNGIDEYLNTQPVLTRWLETAYPKYLPAGQAGPAPHVYFDGEPNAITFMTQAPQSIAPAGMVFMRLWIAGTASSAALLISARPELAWSGKTQTQTEMLLKGIAGVDFAYFGPDLPNGRAYWHRVWKNRAFLPSLIRLRVYFAPGDARKWPDLLIAPRIYVDQSCQLLTVTESSCLGR